MSDIALVAEAAPKSFGSQVRSVFLKQGRGYLQFWPAQQTKVRTIAQRGAWDVAALKVSSQKAIVKARAVEAGQSAEHVHFRYLQRDGVSASSDRGVFYSDCDEANHREFLRRASGDHRHIRLVVSIEQGARLPDLRPVIRELMRQMVRDLQAPIDWIAVDHFNTAYPHSHIVLRIRDEFGRYRSAAPAYLKVGLRTRIRTIATRELGPHEPDRLAYSAGMVTYHGPLAIDEIIIRDARDGQWALEKGATSNREARCLLNGRIKALQRLGVAQELTPGTFRLAPNLAETLGRLEERDRLYASMALELRHAGITKAPSQLALFRPDTEQGPILGRILCAKRLGELRDFLVVEGMDGRASHVPVGYLTSYDVPLTKGMIIKVTARISRDERAIDRSIAAIAARNNEIYCVNRHAKLDRNAAPQFLAAHERRLMELAASGIVAEKVSGVWCIGPKFLDWANGVSDRSQKVAIEVLSFEPLDRLVTWRGATWLDRLGYDRLQLDQIRPPEARDNERRDFLGDLKRCLGWRAEFLLKEGLLRDGITPRNLYRSLRRQETERICSRLRDRLDLEFMRAPAVGALRGTYRGMIALASERLAAVKWGHGFTIVPWCRAMESARGRAVTIMIGRDGRSSVTHDQFPERKI